MVAMPMAMPLLAGMLGSGGGASPFDPSQFDPSSYAPTPAGGAGLPAWLSGAGLPGMLATTGASPAPQPQPAPAPPPPQDMGPTIGPGAPAGPTGGAPVPGSSLLGRILNGLGSRSNTLMQMGAGFAGAPSFGIGMSRAFQGAAKGQQEDWSRQMAMGGAESRYNALIAANASKEESMAYAYSPPDSPFSKTMEEKYLAVPKLLNPTSLTVPTVQQPGGGFTTLGNAPTTNAKVYPIRSMNDLANVPAGGTVQLPDGRTFTFTGRGFGGAQ